MNQFIFITFGTYDFLNQLRNKSNRKLFLFKSFNTSSFQLVDPYHQKTIFKNPSSYQIINAKELNNWSRPITYVHLNLSNKGQKLIKSYFNSIDLNKLSSIKSISLAKDINNNANQIIIISWNKFPEPHKLKSLISINSFTHYNISYKPFA